MARFGLGRKEGRKEWWVGGQVTMAQAANKESVTCAYTCCYPHDDIASHRFLK